MSLEPKTLSRVVLLLPVGPGRHCGGIVLPSLAHAERFVDTDPQGIVSLTAHYGSVQFEIRVRRITDGLWALLGEVEDAVCSSLSEAVQRALHLAAFAPDGARRHVARHLLEHAA